MLTTPHIEKHFTATDVVRDIVIGMSDGLTVPFALAAGLSGATSQSNLVITAGLVEIALAPSPCVWAERRTSPRSYPGAKLGSSQVGANANQSLRVFQFISLLRPSVRSAI